MTVTNTNSRGYALWIESSSPTVVNNTFSGSTHDGISVVGTSRPTIGGNVFSKNGANGITIFGSSQPEVRDNVFENTGFGVNVAQNASPLLIGNKITRNQDGVVVQADARPILRNNYIESNRRDGIVAIARALPDLGTAAEPGGNVIRNNGQYDVNNAAKGQVIPAYGNQLLSSRTTGSVDVAGTFTPPPIGGSALQLTADRPPSIGGPETSLPAYTPGRLNSQSRKSATSPTCARCKATGAKSTRAAKRPVAARAFSEKCRCFSGSPRGDRNSRVRSEYSIGFGNFGTATNYSSQF